MNFQKLWKSQPSKIQYSCNKEYRQWIRTLFDFEPGKTLLSPVLELELEKDIEIDEETRDENFFDSEKMNEALMNLFLATKDHPFFQELYLHAAARMFSTDLEIGQVVVCSYDTFSWYYTCLWYFFHNIGPLDILYEYRQLKQWFSL